MKICDACHSCDKPAEYAYILVDRHAPPAYYFGGRDEPVLKRQPDLCEDCFIEVTTAVWQAIGAA